jgi:predicted transcriptional regulator
MPVKTKTTVYLDEADYGRLQRTGRRLGQPAAELIREAVHEYVVRQAAAELPQSLGIGESSSGDLSERSEEFLAGFGAEPKRSARKGRRRQRSKAKA